MMINEFMCALTYDMTQCVTTVKLDDSEIYIPVVSTQHLHFFMTE